MTEQELQQWLEKENLHRKQPEGWIMDEAEEGIFNPFYEQELIDGQWRAVIGVQLDIEHARRRLAELKTKNPEKQYRIIRANDLDKYIEY